MRVNCHCPQRSQVLESPALPGPSAGGVGRGVHGTVSAVTWEEGLGPCLHSSCFLCMSVLPAVSARSRHRGPGLRQPREAQGKPPTVPGFLVGTPFAPEDRLRTADVPGDGGRVSALQTRSRLLAEATAQRR